MLVPPVPSNTQPPLVLVIEDSDEDYEALRRSFRKSTIATRLHRCQTGDRALAYLTRAIRAPAVAEIPAFILLDLNLPGIDGRRILAALDRDPILQLIPTIVLTTSNYAKDIEECYRLGANSYIIKAIDIEQFRRSILVTIEFWLDTSRLPAFDNLLGADRDNFLT